MVDTGGIHRLEGPGRSLLAQALWAGALAAAWWCLIQVGSPGLETLVADRPEASKPWLSTIYHFDSRGLWMTPAPSLSRLGWILGGGLALALTRLRPPRGLSGPSAVLRASMAACLALLVWAVSLELIRLGWPGAAYTGVTSVSWRLRPGMALPDPPPPPRPPVGDVPAFRFEEVLFSNSLGLREREIPFEKPPGELRIFCAGHSWTFGWGVAAEEAWPRRLEGLLERERPGARVRVINGGMPGHTSLQVWPMLKEIGLRFQPDLVVIGGVHQGEHLPAMDRMGLSSGPWGRSVAWTLLRGLGSLLPAHGRATSTTSLYPARIQELLACHRVPALLYVVPLQARPGETARFREGEGFLEGVLGFRPTPELRLLTLLYPPEEAARFSLRDQGPVAHPHPSVFGHQSIPRSLLEVIRETPAWRSHLARLPEGGGTAPTSSGPGGAP